MPYSTDTAGQQRSLYSAVVTTAGTATGGTITGNMAGITRAVVQAAFTYGSGGTNCTGYVQTSLDGGVSWVDVFAPQFATTTATSIATVEVTGGTVTVTPTDGSLAANTVVNGVLGDRWRVKVVSTGTYAATTLAVSAVTKG